MFESGIDTEHAFGQHGGMTRTGVRTESGTRVRRRQATLTVAAVMVLTLLVGQGHAFRAGAAVRHPRTVVVQRGDSLWEIAERVEPGSDPRSVVAAIARANGVDAASLVPGQRLVLPAP